MSILSFVKGIITLDIWFMEHLRVISFSGDASQLIGTVQRKPGRGDTTLSVSCSDKIARWNVVGVQGLSFDLSYTASVNPG